MFLELSGPGKPALCLPGIYARNTSGGVWDRFEEIRRVLGNARESDVLESVYRGMPPVNLSRCLLQKIPDRLGVVPVKGILWSDWGDEKRIF